MAYKVVIDAGHGRHTEGRRIPAALNLKQPREWELNDRVARYSAERARQYAGLEILRVDDVTGAEDVTLGARCKAANEWGADLYLSYHHNAGANMTSAGGAVCFSLSEGTRGAAWRNRIYARVVGQTGLVGNRANPTTTNNFYVLVHTNMPAVLIEFGFMDSASDAPIIATEGFARSAGYAVIDAIADELGLALVEKEENEMSKEDLEKQIQAAIIADRKTRTYATLEDVPKWGRATVEKLVASNAIQGDGEGLNLSYDLLRILKILDRAGAFDNL